MGVHETDLIMFIDPASKSSGYAIFEASGMFVTSGTSEVKGDIMNRLGEMAASYSHICTQYSIKSVVIERLNYKVHYMAQWSIGAIIAGLNIEHGITELTHQSPGEWKRYLKLRDKSLFDIMHQYSAKSEDEAVAISMGLNHFKAK